MLRKFNMIQTNYNNIVDSNMHPVSGAQLNHILSLLDSCQSAHRISSLTGLNHSTISRLQRKHHPYLKKAPAGCPPKLSELILAMPNTSSLSGRLRMPLRLLRSFRKSPTSPLHLRQLEIT